MAYDENTWREAFEGMYQATANIQYIPLNLINPPHTAYDATRYTPIFESMRTSGWMGRPLVVEKHRDRYQSWTGSHRINAARVALNADVGIPAVVLSDYTVGYLTGKLCPVVAMPYVGKINGSEQFREGFSMGYNSFNDPDTPLFYLTTDDGNRYDLLRELYDREEAICFLLEWEIIARETDVP